MLHDKYNNKTELMTLNESVIGSVLSTVAGFVGGIVGGIVTGLFVITSQIFIYTIGLLGKGVWYLGKSIIRPIKKSLLSNKGIKILDKELQSMIDKQIFFRIETNKNKSQIAVFVNGVKYPYVFELRVFEKDYEFKLATHLVQLLGSDYTTKTDIIVIKGFREIFETLHNVISNDFKSGLLEKAFIKSQKITPKKEELFVWQNLIEQNLLDFKKHLSKFDFLDKEILKTFNLMESELINKKIEKLICF